MDNEYVQNDSWVGFASKTWQVHKFGGTSVANADCYRAAAQIVEEQLGINPEHKGVRSDFDDLFLAVVVSAMGGKPKVTDLLLRSVEAAAARNHKEVDSILQLVLEKHSTCLGDLFESKDSERLLTVVKDDLNDIKDILKTVSLMKWQASRISELVSGYGEVWSAQILATLLQNRSYARSLGSKEQSSSSPYQGEYAFHEFVYIDARRIITIDEEAIQDGAVVWDVSKAKLDDVYKTELAKITSENTRVNSKMHFVITGYVASNTDGVASTLGRDGSDFSAAIFGRLLQSTNITIWTDVDGVLSADPRRVPMAHAVPEVSYNEAMELAYFGAKVIHPKTMQPAISSSPQIPIFIRNTFNSRFRGSRIYTASTTNTEPDKCVCGFSSIDHMALINVEGSGLIGVHGVAKRLFGTLEAIGVNVVLISQASSEHSITFATLEDQASSAKEAITEEFEKELSQNRISNIDVNVPCAIIAAVGDGMHEVAGVSGRFFSALGDAQINVLAISQGSSERNISAVVSSSQSTRALRALHAAFRLSHTAIRVAVVGANEVGVSLLRLLEAQRLILRSTFEIDVQVCSVAISGKDTNILCLSNDTSDESITVAAMKEVTDSSPLAAFDTTVSFATETPCDITNTFHEDLSVLLGNLVRRECAHHVIFDCTNDVEASRFHAKWLSAGVHVVTANNTGLSGTKQERETIFAAESAHGKLSAQYLREVTVGGGLPIINTIRTLLSSGDKIRRVDGIFSVTMSYIMFRISPPPQNARCGAFDKETTKGAFSGDIALSSGCIDFNVPCTFSQAVKEAVALGLTEIDPTNDLCNEYTGRVMMVLARELGMDRNLSIKDIEMRSDKLAEIPEGETRDYRVFEGEADKKISERVASASERGSVIRHVGSIDVASQSIDIKILEVPNNHIFALSPPTCECVRLFTHRYQPYPLVIQGPAAGVDCTSSALLAELLKLMSSKVGPRTGVLSRTGSSAHLS